LAPLPILDPRWAHHVQPLPTPQDAPFELWIMDRDGSNARRLDPSDAAALTALGCVSCAYPSTGGVDLGLPAPIAFWMPAR
jgi:hypothetical protein